MEKTNKKTLEEIIRVDHAGERGAIKIYEGQLLALKTFKQNASLKRKIEEMKEHEREHYEYFDNEIKKRNIQPTKLLPLWDLMGVTLGFGTAMLGEKAAMLCTASVEEVIDVHYKDQTGKQIQDVLSTKIKSFPNINLLENHTLVDLITDHHSIEKKGRCYGAYVISQEKEEIIKICSKITVLSTGGAGSLYAHTTKL